MYRASVQWKDTGYTDMQIGLIDVDGHNFPNLPLMKISAYHKSLGDNVEFVTPIECKHYDKVYQSKVFTFTPDYDFCISADEVQKGGTGYGLENKLTPCIENMCPDYGLYPQFSEAYGFLTRGCPRGCPFCIVAQKEGCKSVQVADLDNFYRGQKVIKLLDPNITACSDRERLFKQLIDSGAWVDFTQGLDIRLVSDIEDLIAKVKVKMLHFAWDNPEQDLTGYFQNFKKKTNLDERRLRVYVLTNFWSTHEQDLYRVYKLREMGYDPYIMIYEKETAPRETRLLQRWVNNKIIFRSCERFEDYDCRKG